MMATDGPRHKGWSDAHGWFALETPTHTGEKMMADAACRKIQPVLSPVNYDAWYREGYMPPSEHLLIDRLQRGAKVIASTSGQNDGVWLVVQGDMTRKKIAALGKWLHITLATLDEGEAAPPTQDPSP